ncbi:hypothetical protein WR25_14111 isoform A [Diploscapter pachys]|uniref:Piwi domain-containing protein n=2 Tax=Diploscapter pachys TaxID=2018661 RepID=A0A2A2KLK7_9BILA|nr:hypothetical protein WR25_14111 isoform A [Diploscapter pachys]
MTHTLDLNKIDLKSKLGATYAEKKSSGNIGHELAFVTNLTKIDVQKNVVFFKYDVSIDVVFKKPDGSLVEDKPKSITKGRSNDHSANKRKAKAVEIMDKLQKGDEADFFRTNEKGQQLVYDRQAVLFSTLELKVDSNGKKLFKLPPTIATKKEDAAELRITIQKCADSFQVSSNDFAKAVNIRPEQADKGFLEVVNLSLSKVPFTDNQNWVTFGQCNHYITNPSEQIRRNDLAQLEENMTMTLGVSKSVKVLEGQDKSKPSVYAVTEVKKAALHNPDNSLIVKVHAMIGHNSAQPTDRLQPNRPDQRIVGEKLKELTVMVRYGRDWNIDEPTTFVIGHTNGRAANDPSTSFTVEHKQTGQMIRYASIEDYFNRKYGIKLQYPGYFMVAPKTPMKGGHRPWFPLEVLGVCDMQRVKKNQESVQNQSKIIRASAALPERRLNQTREMKRMIGLEPNNADLNAIGMRADADFTRVTGRVLPQPAIEYARPRNQQEGPKIAPNNGKWQSKREQFYQAKKVPAWHWIGLFRGRAFENDKETINSYYEWLLKEMRNRGMTCNDAAIDYYEAPNVGHIKKIFEGAKQNKQNEIKYLFFVSDDNVKLHDDIKLMEQQTGILTQEVRLSKVKEVIQKGRAETLANVIMKINQKIGGINHKVSAVPLAQSLKQNLKSKQAELKLPMENPSALIVGFEMSGTGSDTPVLGFAGNSHAEPQYFRGDYRYYEANNRDSVALIMAQAIESLVQTVTNARKVEIKETLVYINGPSEGSYPELLTKFVPAFEKVIPSGAKLTLIVASKTHNERIFSTKINPSDKATQQNIPSGAVIDSVITSPVITEFYLTPHQAFQGTAKPVKYAVVYDRNGYSIDVLEANTFVMSFQHGIVNIATSLPIPLLVADRMAKRGRNNLKAHGGSVDGENRVDIARLNEDLTYRNNGLKAIRFNA